MSNVLIDFHHYELSLSLCLLLRRFGCNIYLPTPETIADKGFFGFGHNSFSLYQDYTLPYDGTQHIDLAIASCPTNYRAYSKLFPKTIIQIGNQEWTLEEFDNVLTSDLFTWNRLKNRCKHICYYYPEIDLKAYQPKMVPNRFVRSYIQNLHSPYTYDRCKVCDTAQRLDQPDYQVFLDCQKKLLKYDIQLVSHGYTANNLNHLEVPQYMNNSRLTWHFKTIEGYGFAAITSMFCGVPVLINPKWLAGTTLGSLSILGKTAMFSDYSYHQIIKNVKRFLEEPHYEAQQKCAVIIRALMNFDEEADKVKRFIENVA